MAFGLYPIWLLNLWGWPSDLGIGCIGFVGPIYATNPDYNLDTFFGFYPKFFGPSSVLAGVEFTVGLSSITVPSANGMLAGQFVQSSYLPTGTVITSVSGSTVTLNNAATATTANGSLTIYTAPVVPPSIIQAYINLATASLSQEMWGDSQWPIAMGWFVAHYCTLWAQTEAGEMQIVLQTVMHGEEPQGAIPGTSYTLSSAPPGGALSNLVINGLVQNPTTYTVSGNGITLTTPTIAGDTLYAVWPIQQPSSTTTIATPAQIAAQGVAQGILTSKSVGDVSASYSVLQGLEGWGAFNLTKYGQQLATMAKTVGSGPCMIW